MLLESTHPAIVATDGGTHGKNDKWFVHEGWFVHVELNQLFQFRSFFCLIPGLRHSNAIKGLETRCNSSFNDARNSCRSRIEFYFWDVARNKLVYFVFSVLNWN